jgi:hypothetical protein
MSRTPRAFLRAASLAILGIAAATPYAKPAFLGPTPYLSFADSPFNGGSFGYFFLETFEDGLLNTPGVSASSGSVTSPGPLTDSVDGDDGAIDGSGIAGHSYISNSSTSLTFTFNAAALGGKLPTSVGIVWTDVGTVTSGTFGFGPVSFSATDQNGASLGSIGPFTLGDGAINGGTAEDRFFGVTNAGGISSITITTANSTDWEVDHLQYGASAPVPEPSSLALLAASAGSVVVRRFRRPRPARRPA